MEYNAATHTLTLGQTDCSACKYMGKPGQIPVLVEADCPKCKGTGKRGNGTCRNYGCVRGKKEVLSDTLWQTCSKCKGSTLQAETWCDYAPSEAVTAIPVRVTRQNRDISMNESLLGLGCLWSCTDYGSAWDGDDADLQVKITEQLATQRVQATNIVDRETGAVVDEIIVIVSRGGYSLRTGSGAEARASRELSYAAGLVVGSMVAESGDNGTIFAATYQK